MSTVGTIYGTKVAPKVLRVHAAAAYNGVKVEHVEYSVQNGDNQKPEFVEKFPNAKLPGFTSSEGLNLFEGSAIARFGEHPDR